MHVLQHGVHWAKVAHTKVAYTKVWGPMRRAKA